MAGVVVRRMAIFVQACFSYGRFAGFALACGLGLAACRSVLPDAVAPVSALPVRFLITFDDGPSGAARNNSTALILDTLAHNRWQDGIKAIFFVQTRHRTGGGTGTGQQLMQRMHRDGHLLALHTASVRGHVNHTQMPLAELDRNLGDGIEDIRRISGAAARFVRPPFWHFNPATLARYEMHGLSMLLDDISIRDGKVWGITSNPNARKRIRADLHKVARRIRDGELPAVSGYFPLVMTMHDTNSTTARNLESYLGMLVEEARHVGLLVHPQPFITPGEELIRVATLRANRPLLARAETAWPTVAVE
jgi:peptidoglycan/xylan/chitin deacetylase (PgdA/CDA1 family)